MDRRPEQQRRTRTLWEQLSRPDPAIRDFLNIPHDADGGEGEAEPRPCTDAIGRDSHSESVGRGMITLMDAISRDTSGESVGRGMITLMDTSAESGGGGMITLMDAIGRDIRGGSGDGSMINWKPLRLGERLRLRRAANARSTTTTSNRRGDEDCSEEEEEEGSKDEAPAAASTSLMALLEDDDEEDEDGRGSAPGSSGEAGEEDGEEQDMARACCVCMLRHKGAAFIPCGHTFCRLCSRDLWLTRATCPLCNAFIHDVLHIF